MPGNEEEIMQLGEDTIGVDEREVEGPGVGIVCNVDSSGDDLGGDVIVVVGEGGGRNGDGEGEDAPASCASPPRV